MEGYEKRERREERGIETEREWFGEHLLHPTLYQALLFAFDQMSSWYSGWFSTDLWEESQRTEEFGIFYREIGNR